MAGLSKAEYLKRYMSDSSSTEKKKKKRKVPKTQAIRSRIVDDDIDLKSLLPSNINNTLEEDVGDNEPTIAGVIDERPEHVRIIESYRNESKWKLLTQEEKDQIEEASRNGKLQQNDSNQTSRKRQRHDSDSDQSPQRRNRHDSDSDQSPPRRSRHDSDSDQSPLRRNRHDSDSDQSPPRRKRHDSDGSPNQSKHSSDIKNYKNAELHGSELRNMHQKSSIHRQSNEKGNVSSHSRKKRHNSDSDQSLPRRKRHNSDSDQSPPRRKRHNSDSDQSPPRRKRHNSDSDQSPPRRKKHNSDRDQSPPRRKRSEINSEDDTSKQSSKDRDQSKMKKTLSGKKAGLSSAKDMKKEAQILKQKEDEAFRKIGDDLLGKNAKTVFRNNSGKKRNLKEEQELSAEEIAKKAEIDAKYQQWGKGLKQQEMRDATLNDHLHEMSKPLARYEDDTDLDAMLREQERADDPMLAFIKKKKTKDKKPDKPKYRGPAPPPNRFGIMPGYRWDGVDRSNGFEKSLFAKISEKKAVNDMAYKWSVEDM